MFRTFGVAFVILGLAALKAQDPSYDNLAPFGYDAPGDYDDYVDDGQLIETDQAPPPLPEYDQPEIPGDDYYWTPGYWAWGPGGYYWVPGAWVLAPYVGAVWTPPYWAFEVNNYRWHPGYWGSHVGFYGGIDYGFGYTGRGYYGAYWNAGHLRYNRAVTRVNVNIVRNVYNYSVPRGTVSRVSFNGGRGGINVRATPQERAVVRDRRMPAIAAQTQHAREAANNRAQFAQGGRLRQDARVTAGRLNTNYQAPAAQAPAAARIVQQRQRGQRPENRQVPQASEHRLELGPAPAVRPAPQVAPQPVPQRTRPTPEPRHDARPIPQQQRERRGPERQQMRQENRPPAPAAQPAPHPQPAPQAQPVPQQRPAAPPRMREPQQQRQPQPQQPPHPDHGGGRGPDNKGR